MDNIVQQNTVLIKVALPATIHRRLKMSAADRGQTVPERVASVLDASLPYYEEKETSNATA